MSAEIVMPQLGETVAEGKILAWFKAVGDEVKLGDRLFEVETDKVTIEVEAVSAGKLSAIRVGEGETVNVGTVVAVIGGAAEAAPVRSAPKAAAAAPAFKPPQPALVAAASKSTARSPFEEVETPVRHFGDAKAGGDTYLSPRARRLVAESGIDIAVLASATPNGQLGEAHIKAALLADPSLAKTSTIVPLNAIRQRTADRLAENWRTIPHVFQATEVDFTAVEAVRAKAKAAFKAAYGVSLTYLPFIARATAIALKEFPLANAKFDGKSLLLSRAVNLGIAVDLNHNGLVVPVVKSAEDLNVGGLAKAIGRLVEKARAGKLSPDDLTGGTYSISNNGAFGTLFTSPIINGPQVAILSTDAIRMRPAVVRNSIGDFIAPRLIGVVGQSFDHRAFDGAYSAAFLARLKAIIEERDWQAELASEI